MRSPPRFKARPNPRLTLFPHPDQAFLCTFIVSLNFGTGLFRLGQKPVTSFLCGFKEKGLPATERCAVRTDDSVDKFHRLLWPQLANVLRVARILCGDAVEAEDLAQETMLRAYRAVERFTEGTDAKAWLLTILRNVRIDRIRSAASKPNKVSLDAMEADPADGSASLEQERISDQAWQDPAAVLNAFSDQQMIDAMNQLPEEIRLTLLLVDVEQMEHADAAKILEVPVGTIKSRTHRGRSMLRQALLPLAKELRLVRE